MFWNYIASRSGYVQPREGLALGWVVAAFLGLALLLGSAQQASADYCWGVPEGSEQWVCTPNSCGGNMYWRLLVWHSPTCCPHCEVRDSSCSCT